jgi:hypothetical protein
VNITINISDTDLLCLKHDLVDVEKWVQDAVTGKINNCKKRMVTPYQSPLVNKTDEEIVTHIITQDNYEDRLTRDAHGTVLDKADAATNFRVSLESGKLTPEQIIQVKENLVQAEKDIITADAAYEAAKAAQ